MKEAGHDNIIVAKPNVRTYPHKFRNLLAEVKLTSGYLHRDFAGEDGASEPVQGKGHVEKSSGTVMAITSKVSPLKGVRIASTCREGCNPHWLYALCNRTALLRLYLWANGVS